jgi:hypothetical protein
MFSPKVKKILSRIMIAGDILLGTVFLAELLEGNDPLFMIFLMAFLTVDAFLSFDYIGRLKKEEEEELKKAYRKENPGRELDRQMAEDISSATEAYDIDPEELAKILADHRQNRNDTLRRR